MIRYVIALAVGLVMIASAAMSPADLVTTIDAHYASVNAVGIGNDGQLYTGGKDGKLKLWDTATYDLLMEVPACQVAINDIAVSDDGMYMATASADGYVKVWDAATADLVVAINAHEKAANCVAFSPDSLFIYSGGDDGFVRIWGVDEGFDLVYENHANFNGVNDLILAYDGGYLFTGGVDGYVNVYNAVTGVRESRIKAFENAEVLCMTFNDIESCLFTGGTNGEVRCWDAATGSMSNVVRAHAGNVNFISWAPNNNLLVSGGEDGKIKLWNTEGDMAGEMQAHVLGVRDILFFDGTMVSGGSDYKVRVWEMNF